MYVVAECYWWPWVPRVPMVYTVPTVPMVDAVSRVPVVSWVPMVPWVPIRAGTILYFAISIYCTKVLQYIDILQYNI